jgi:hypothetical protein
MNFKDTEKTFYFDYTSELGQRYEGNFTVKCLLTMGEKHRLELEKTRLLGNSVNPTAELLGIATILATLKHKIVDAPNWWKQSNGGEKIQELDILTELFYKVDDMEQEWKAELLKKAEKVQTPTE